MKSSLAMRLKLLRKNLSMSAARVVKLLKKNNLVYSEQSIYKWEQGNAVPDTDTLNELAKIYNCNLSYLIEGKKYKFLRVTPCEYSLLRIYRTDFLFRSILTQIITRINRDF